MNQLNKKLIQTMFLGIPLTSSKKEGSYYFSFNYIKDIINTVILNQMRVFDIRRTEYLSGKINKKTYQNQENNIIEFMKITSSKRRGVPTRAKSNNILSKKSTNGNED